MVAAGGRGAPGADEDGRATETFLILPFNIKKGTRLFIEVHHCSSSVTHFVRRSPGLRRLYSPADFCEGDVLEHFLAFVMLLIAREAEIIIAAFAVYPTFCAVDFIAMTAKEVVAAVFTDDSGAINLLTKIKFRG